MSKKIEDGLGAKGRYDKQFKSCNFKLHRGRDAELIRWLETQNVNALVRSLLLKEKASSVV